MKFCYFCKEKVADDARFCGKCGKQIEHVCEHCGAEYASEDIYCKVCGNKLSENYNSTKDKKEEESGFPKEYHSSILKTKINRLVRTMLSKKIVLGVLATLILIFLLVFSLKSLKSKNVNLAMQEEQKNKVTQNSVNSGVDKSKISDKYIIGNGKIGLLTVDMPLDVTKRILVEQYNARFVQRKEPIGEGMTAQVVNAYFNNEKVPSIKFYLTDNGEIYQRRIMSPDFYTPEGIHVGSTWGEIRRIYPKAYFIWIEGPFLLIPEISVACSIKFNSKQDHMVLKGKETYSDDTSITEIFIKKPKAT